jgi:hypothetical protein
MNINKIFKFLLGIDFVLLALSVILMLLGINVRQFHIIFGGILLLLGTIHILSHRRIKK